MTAEFTGAMIAPQDPPMHRSIVLVFTWPSTTVNACPATKALANVVYAGRFN